MKGDGIPLTPTSSGYCHGARYAEERSVAAAISAERR
jgi:hypothetical protein